jgi:polyhydroxyalkanoate synthesis regulator phasin
MIESLKKTLLAGVGAAVVTKDKVEAALAEYVKQGKVTSAEARAMAEKIAADGKKEFETLSGELNDKFKDVVAGFNRNTQERLEALEARVNALEHRHEAKAKGKGA